MMRIVVFASGRGSNARNIFGLSRTHPDLISVEALITNKPKAGVIAHAKDCNIPTFVIPLPKIKNRKERRIKHEELIHKRLQSIPFDYICLAGYMRVFTADFVSKYTHNEWPVSKIINIHPALLPSFPGTQGYADAYAYGVRHSGVTTHFVDDGVDTGAIIHQRIFPRNPRDSYEDFSTRGLQEEYICYRETLLALAKNEITVQSNPFHIFLSKEVSS